MNDDPATYSHIPPGSDEHWRECCRVFLLSWLDEKGSGDMVPAIVKRLVDSEGGPLVPAWISMLRYGYQHYKAERKCRRQSFREDT